MAKTSLCPTDTRDMMLAVAAKIIESEPILTDADRALGDGDHGVGMERGMHAVIEALSGTSYEQVGKVFVAVGTAMMSSMGGASGALFGTFFRSGGKAMGESATFGSGELAALVREGTDALMARGGAKQGDKTMVDALVPAAEAAEAAQAAAGSDDLAAALAAVAAAAEAGKEASKDLIATMGRAKTLGEKAIGKPDAGAVSVAIIFATMSEFVPG
jgi:dihydroxyacetone kinase phosphoprotein-dependent L subunit